MKLFRCAVPLFAALAVVLPATLWSAAPAQAARGLEFAVQDDGVFLRQEGMSREQALQIAKSMGVTRIRTNVIWAWNMPEEQRKARKEPKRIDYYFHVYDSLVDDAARYGIRVQMTLTGTSPAFATANKKIGNYKPNAKAFGRFVRAWVSHFKDRVDRFSMWNEPNWKTWLLPHKQSPQLYRKLYLEGFRQAKNADPKAQVFFGELAPHNRRGVSIAPLRFMRGALCVNSRYVRRRGCGVVRADGVAHHPYDFTHSPRYKYRDRDVVTIGTLSRMSSAMVKLRRAGALRTPRNGTPGLYLTEYGYFNQGKRKLPVSRRAQYLKQSLEIARRAPLVRQLTQYMLLSLPAGDKRWDTGVLNHDGSHNKITDTLIDWISSQAERGGVKLPPDGALKLPLARR